MKQKVNAMVKLNKIENELLNTALKAMNNAYVLWGIKVGAAVLAEDGKIYGGCNVESWISGLGICAERCAINHAISHGNCKIKTVALVMNANKEPRPCGACLQYIYDFAENPKIKILMAKAKNGKILFETVEVKSIKELLPFPFRK